MKSLAAVLRGICTFAAVFVVGIFALGLLAAAIEVSMVVVIFVIAALLGWGVFRTVTQRQQSSESESNSVASQTSMTTEPRNDH